jgi:hypothetical protein
MFGYAEGHFWSMGLRIQRNIAENFCEQSSCPNNHHFENIASLNQLCSAWV